MARKGDDIVFVAGQPSRCARCATVLALGNRLVLRDGEVCCLPCAGLATLEFLPAGDPAVTRRASKHSSCRALVVQWSRVGKRYQRTGTLLQPQAIVRAREECEADAATRQARQAKAATVREAQDRQYLAQFTAELKRLFPGCPSAEAEQIALHACEKYSGRVGRSAAAKDLDPEKIRLAVIAHIRHVHTGYDGFFDINVRKQEARRLVQVAIQRVLSQWERPAASLLAAGTPQV